MESATSKPPLAAAAAALGEEATRRAVAQAVAGVDEPSLALVFSSQVDPPRAAAEAFEAAGGAPTAGLTGSGVVGPDGALEQGCAALAFGPEAGTAIAGVEAGDGLRHAARAAAEAALSGLHGGPPSLLLLFLDTRSGDQAEAIAGAYEVAGPAVPLAGGAAGGLTPAQLAGGRAFEESVVAVALTTPGPVEIAVRHGCRSNGSPSIVTRSRGRLIFELDGEPAASSYLRNLGFDDAGLDDEAFEALAVTHPLAQPELSGQARIRHILGRDGEALVCATHIPANAAIEYTREAPEDIVATAATAVHEAISHLDGQGVRAALVFDCAGRKRAVARSLTHEISALLAAFGRPPPVAGLFTHGEVARVRGAKGDRNHAVVIVAFG